MVIALAKIAQSTRVDEDIAVVEIRESIRFDNAPALARYLKSIREKHIAIDLSKVDEARTVLMAQLIGEFQRRDRYGGRIALYGLNEQTKKVVSFSNFERVISCYETRDQALDYLRNGH